MPSKQKTDETRSDTSVSNIMEQQLSITDRPPGFSFCPHIEPWVASLIWKNRAALFSSASPGNTTAGCIDGSLLQVFRPVHSPILEYMWTLMHRYRDHVSPPSSKQEKEKEADDDDNDNDNDIKKYQSHLDHVYQCSREHVCTTCAETLAVMATTMWLKHTGASSSSSSSSGGGGGGTELQTMAARGRPLCLQPERLQRKLDISMDNARAWSVFRLSCVVVKTHYYGISVAPLLSLIYSRIGLIPPPHVNDPSMLFTIDQMVTGVASFYEACKILLEWRRLINGGSSSTITHQEDGGPTSTLQARYPHVHVYDKNILPKHLYDQHADELRHICVPSISKTLPLPLPLNNKK